MTAAFDDFESHWPGELAEVNAGSIAVAVVLSYIDFRLPDINWRDGRPKLTSFHQAFSKRDSMMKTAL